MISVVSYQSVLYQVLLFVINNLCQRINKLLDRIYNFYFFGRNIFHIFVLPFHTSLFSQLISSYGLVKTNTKIKKQARETFKNMFSSTRYILLTIYRLFDWWMAPGQDRVLGICNINPIGNGVKVNC